MRLVGLLSLRQFPVHWERNENKHAISKAYRMGPILWLAGLDLDHRPLWLLRQPPPRLGHAIQLCTQQPKRSPLMPGASSELQLLMPAKRPLLARPCRFGVISRHWGNVRCESALHPKADMGARFMSTRPRTRRAGGRRKTRSARDRHWSPGSS